MSADNQTCSKRNIHGRKLKEISRVTVYIGSHRINDRFHCAFRPAVVGKLLTFFRLHNAYTFPLRRPGSYFMGLIEITFLKYRYILFVIRSPIFHWICYIFRGASFFVCFLLDVWSLGGSTTSHDAPGHSFSITGCCYRRGENLCACENYKLCRCDSTENTKQRKVWSQQGSYAWHCRKPESLCQTSVFHYP